MYKCKYFIIQELVPEHIYKKRGEKAWELLDEKALITLDKLREKFGQMTVNSWVWGGKRNWSGLRTPSSKHYSETSQHSAGKAFDCIFKNYTPDQVRDYVLENPNEFIYLTALEMEISWFHFDVRNCNSIKKFYP